jgi:hypothetical protein
MAVAYLHEEELSLPGCFSAETRRAGDTSAYCPQQAGADPSHAAEEIPPIETVRIEGRVRGLVRGSFVGRWLVIRRKSARRVGGVRHRGFVSRKVKLLYRPRWFAIYSQAWPARRLLIHTTRQEASIHREKVPGNEARRFGCEKDGGTRDFFGLTEAPHWRAHQELAAAICAIEQPFI